MKDIYSRAKEVVIWLGEAADNSPLAMHLMGRISHKRSIFKKDYPPENLVSDYKRHIQAWTALAELFARKFWHRVWIIQESATCHPATSLLRESLHTLE